MWGNNNSGEDRLRPLPKHRHGKGLVTVGRPLGEIVEKIGTDPVGYVSRGERTWSCDLHTYRLLELAQRGHSERWLRDQLAQKGVDREAFESAKGFCLQAGLVREYSAVDGTLDGRRSLKDLVVRRRLSVEKQDGDRWLAVIPEGGMWIGHYVANWSLFWNGHPLADSSNFMLEGGHPIEDAIWWPFWEAIRGLELGLIWLDVPKEKVGPGVKDGGGHWIKSASLWVKDEHWGAKPGSYGKLMSGPIEDSVSVLALATPLGNTHGDSGWMARNYRGAEVELSADAYALLCDVNFSPIAEVVARVQQIELSMFSHGRVRKATDELLEKDCIGMATTPA